MRDKFVVDINLKDGEPFKGTVSRTEALKQIFVKALGFSPAEFHGATPAFKGHPVVVFKTKEVFNIDERLAGKSSFVYQKKVKTDQGERTVEMSCTIKGIREADPAKRAASIYTWLKIEGAEYQLKEDQLKMWLSNYGFLVSGITEDKEEAEGESSEDDEIYNDVDINTGIYSAKIKLNKDIPQLIPMHSKKIKIYHKGIKKQCMNCYGTGHFKRDCMAERKEWLDYVDGFMLASLLPEAYYGNWMKLVEEWRSKNPGKHEQNRADKEEETRRQEESRRGREESVKEITKILQEQRLSSDKNKESGREEMEEDLRKQDQIAEQNTDQEEQAVFVLPEKKVETKVSKKPTAKGKGRGKGKGELRSLQSSPTTTPQNGKQNE